MQILAHTDAQTKAPVLLPPAPPSENGAAASSLTSRSFYGTERAIQTERAVAAALDSVNGTCHMQPLGTPPFSFFPLQQQAFDRWDTEAASSRWAPHLR